METRPLSLRILTLDLCNKPPPSRRASPWLDYCIVRMVGKTRDNKNACVWVDGFYPYFFLQLPDDWKDYQLPDLRRHIVENVKNMEHNLMDCSLQLSLPTYGYQDGKLAPFVKLSFRGVKTLRACARLFQNEVTIGDASEDDAKSQFFKVCEHKKVPELLKAIHDTGMQPSGWIEVTEYVLVDKESRTDFNVHAALKCIKPFADDYIPRFIEMSFDGEMVSQAFVFPNPKRPWDVICQLGVEFCYFGEKTPYRRVMFCLDSIDTEKMRAEGIEVKCHFDEKDMMMDFRRTVVEENPDIVTGYNIIRFDFPYILRRAKYLGMPAEFYDIGRFYGEATELKVSYRSILRGDTSDKKIQYDVPVVPGRRLEDCYVSVKNMPKKLSSYKLDYVGNFYLGVGKHDVEPEDIFRAYQNTTDYMIAKNTENAVRQFLTELRVMLAFDLVTRTETLFVRDAKKAVCDMWPPEFVAQIAKTFQGISFGDKAAPDAILTPEDATVILANYITHRLRGETLCFTVGGGTILANLDDHWFKRGISHQQIELDVTSPLPVAASSKKKRVLEEEPKEASPSLNRQEGFYQVLLHEWESRILAETEVLQHVIDGRVTRKFAEKWWLLNKQVADNIVSAEQRQKVTVYLDEQQAKHVAWLLSEKTRIALYCGQDCSLPSQLRAKQQHMISLMEMSKVTSVPCNMLLEMGQTIKVINLLLIWARGNNAVATVVVLPNVHFEGAVVLKPKKGFYRARVFTLDYSSLYPSLIQMHKLCWLSLILPSDLHKYIIFNEDGTFTSLRPDLDIRMKDLGPPSNQRYYWVVNKRTALPEILESLVSQRSQVKVELENEKDPARKVILDQRQNALKLVGNSAYGFTGYERSPWPCLPIACVTTLEGRLAIGTAKDKAETKFGATVIYGDSVTPDTPILIRDGTLLRYVAVEDIPRATDWMPYLGEKEWAQVSPTVQVWSDQGFTAVRRIIRHMTEKQIYTVVTRDGMVKVTADHSLLDSEGNTLAPTAIGRDTLLMHSQFPTVIDNGVLVGSDDLDALMNGPLERVREFLQEGVVTVESEVEAAKYVFLADRIGWSVDVLSPGWLRLCPWLKEGKMWTSVEFVGYSLFSPVYDLETDNHHFAAGIGKIVVHNTDSIMAIVDIPGHLTTDLDKMEYVFHIAQEAADYITSFFTKPMRILFEKVYFPYLLLSAKRYSGMKFTKPHKPDGVDTKGVEAIRRDNCPLLKTNVVAMLNALATEMDTGKAVQIARSVFQRLANQDASWEDLTITKLLGDNYAADTHIHVRVAQYLAEKHPLLAPEVGDRVPYVIVKRSGDDRNTKAYTKGYNPQLAEKDGMEADWEYYCFNCIKKPIDRIVCIMLGYEYQKGREKQPVDYLWAPFLKQICDNGAKQTQRMNGNIDLTNFYQKKPRIVVEELSPEEALAQVAKVEAKAQEAKVENVPMPPPPPPKKSVLQNSDIRKMFAPRGK